MTALARMAAFGLVAVPGVAEATSGVVPGTELGSHLPLWSVVPFVALLLCIAILPLAAGHWWESNRHKLVVALLLGVPTACYIGQYDLSIVIHALIEYAAFIVLLGTLYVISGGLVLRGDLKATPAVNTLFLAIGAVLANLIGTTGASMLLIRPMLQTNAEREHKAHIPVFFIFVVANMGGMLTPLGDPPLFLGFLRGVPFVWTLRLLPIWALGVGLILAIFYVWDRRAHALETTRALRLDRALQIPLTLAGKVNLPLLAGVIGSVFLPGTLRDSGYGMPWREAAMVSLAILSLQFTPLALRQENRFTTGPIIEVAALFIGIFLAMIPALELLRARGSELGLTTPWHFFWATGVLSSFLDNAPTYVSFLSLAQGLGLPHEVAGVSHAMLRAISAGAVAMGANSYIGNGPNFMVKAIADEAGIAMPSFFGYMLRAILILGPIFVLMTLLFFV